MTKPQPRLAIGDQVISHRGEWDEGDQPLRRRETGPNATGIVGRIDGPHGAQGYIYSVTFDPSGVWVFLDDRDFDADPTAYTLLPAR